MIPNEPCPPLEQLERLVDGRLSTELSDQLAEHLEKCDACREAIERDSGFVDLAPRLSRLENSSEDSAELAKALAKVKQEQNPWAHEESAIGSAAADIPVDDTAALIAWEASGFEQIETIGRGGMGVVVKARDPSLDRVVAVKVLSPYFGSDEVARERFLREAQLAASINHANIVTIHAVADTRPLPYLVMEFVEGPSLQELLDTQGRFETDEVIRVGRQIASGLGAAHAKGIVHRDIKPANILMDSETRQVKLTDFGLALSAGQLSSLTRTGMLVGSPAFIAPERLSDDGSADHRADLFSLGSVLYAMCSGAAPFETESLLTTLHRISSESPRPICNVVRTVPPRLAAVIDRLLAKDPAERFQSASEVEAALSSAQTFASPPEPPPIVRTVERPTVRELSSGNGSTGAKSSSPVVRAKPRHSRRQRSPWSSYAIAAAVPVLLLLLLGAMLVAIQLGKNSSRDQRNNAKPRQTVRSNDRNDVGKRSVKEPVGSQPERRESEASRSVVPPARSTDPSPDASVASGSSGPFVVVEEGAPPRAFSLLQDAVDAAVGEGRIEIRDDGPHDIKELSFGEKPVTLVAGDGFQPVLRFQPDEFAGATISDELRLEGLQLELVEPPDNLDACLLRVEEGELTATRCRFVVPGHGCCIMLDSADDVRLIECELYAAEGSPLGLLIGEPGKALLENCVLSGPTGIQVEASESFQLKLQRCTLVAERVLQDFGGDDEQDEDEDEADEAGCLTVMAHQSLFVSSIALVSVDDSDISEREFRQRLVWTGAGNVYSGPFVVLGEDDDEAPDWCRDFTAWKGISKEREPRLVPQPFATDVDEMLPKLERPARLRRADFRPHAEVGEGVGALWKAVADE